MMNLLTTLIFLRTFLKQTFEVSAFINDGSERKTIVMAKNVQKQNEYPTLFFDKDN